MKIDGGRATVTYTPLTELDYGTLLCYGTNEVGQQHTPCVFHVFPAGQLLYFTSYCLLYYFSFIQVP